MTKILGKDKYPIKTNPVSEDYVIGSDSENNGKTVNFNIGDIAALSGGGSAVNQNNKIKVLDITFSSFIEPTEQDVVDAINTLPTPLVVSEDELVIINVIIQQIG